MGTWGTKELGEAGERLAEHWLVAQGWEVLARNWRCRWGELDLVAADPGGRLVMVEVKTRSTVACGMPLEAVSEAKARRLRRLGWAWVSEHPEAPIRGWSGFRIDLLAILVRDGRAELDHLRGVA